MVRCNVLVVKQTRFTLSVVNINPRNIVMYNL